VKTVRFRGGYRKGDPDRHSYAFFVVGALVVIAIAFFVGLQVGRVVEKSASKERAAGSGQLAAVENGARGSTAADIRKDLSAFSEDAVRIPVVTPPEVTPRSAGEELRRTEESATFPETLTRKDPSPPPLVKAKTVRESPEKAGFLVQAGALKSRDAAERLRRRLEKAGYKATVSRAATRASGDVFRVRVGPFSSRDEATKAMKGIKSDLKIDTILVKG